MPQLFIILLKINLVLLLFAAAYYLILRRLTFYTLNRVFLVFGILFSTIYPFINLTDFFHRQKQINQEVVAFVPKLNQEVNNLVPSNFITANWQVISIVFYVGVCLMAFRLFLQFISLYNMHRKSSPGAVANYPVRILQEAVSPFSFWQTVYINPALHQEKELGTILAHEQVHVKQWHSLDIILAELSVVFYWFNPGVWLMKKAVKENLEFITDQKILNKGIDKKSYQYSLLDVGNLIPAVAIVNNFNLSDLKKRIKMMNVKRSSRLTLSRYLLVTPILLITTLAFTVAKKDLRKHLIPLRQVLVDTHLIDATPVALKTKTILRTVKRKKVAPVAPAEKKDSVNKVTVFLRTVFLHGDSSGILPGDLPIVVKERMAKGMIRASKSGATENYMFFPDSLPRESMREFKDVQVQMKMGMPLPNDKKVIVVKGFSSKKRADSLKGSAMDFYIDGKKVAPEDVDNLTKPENIKNVHIRKMASTSGIEINMKEQ
jgi:hypothetical protein